MWSTSDNNAVLYYAVGGGWGHVHRSLRVIARYLGGITVYLVTNHRRFGIAVPRNVRPVYMPPSLAYDVQAYRAYFQHLLGAASFDALWIDVFPWGVQGELHRVAAFLAPLPKVLVSRYIQWERYAVHCGHKPAGLERIYLLEGVHPQQRACFESWGVEIQALPLDFSLPEGGDFFPELPYGVVLHTGNSHELCRLGSYAKHLAPCLRWYYVAPRPCPDLGREWYYAGRKPYRLFLEEAQYLVSAAGFNTMRELLPFRDKHHVLPFARRYDNQFWRWAYYRSGNCSAGSV